MIILTHELIGLKRRRAGMTIGELADKAGISRNYMAEIESGKNKNYTISTLNKIAKALECGVEIRLIAQKDIKDCEQ